MPAREFVIVDGDSSDSDDSDESISPSHSNATVSSDSDVRRMPQKPSGFKPRMHKGKPSGRIGQSNSSEVAVALSPNLYKDLNCLEVLF